MTNKNKKIEYSVIQEYLGDLRKWNRESKTTGRKYSAQDVIDDLSAAFSEYILDY